MSSKLHTGTVGTLKALSGDYQVCLHAQYSAASTETDTRVTGLLTTTLLSIQLKPELHIVCHAWRRQAAWHRGPRGQTRRGRKTYLEEDQEDRKRKEDRPGGGEQENQEDKKRKEAMPGGGEQFGTAPGADAQDTKADGVRGRRHHGGGDVLEVPVDGAAVREPGHGPAPRPYRTLNRARVL